MFEKQGVRGCLLCWLVLVAGGVFPQARSWAEAEKVVVADGMADVVVDPVSARDRALVDAKRKAVEQGVGTIVDQRALYSMGLAESDWTRVRAFGFVRRYEVLDEKPGIDRYEVKIRAWVRRGGGSERLALENFLSDRNCVIQAVGRGASTVVEKLESALLSKGFRVFETSVPGGGGAPGAGGGDAQRFLADVLVMAEVRVSPLGEMGRIHAYRADATLRAEQAGTGRLLVVAERSGRVFGLSEDQALRGARADQFPKAVALPLTEEFVGRLLKAEVGKRGPVRLVLEGPARTSSSERLVETVKGLRWVEDCRIDSVSDERWVLQVDYPEKVVFLAADLDFLTGFTVASYGPRYVTLRRSPPPD